MISFELIIKRDLIKISYNFTRLITIIQNIRIITKISQTLIQQQHRTNC